MKQKKIFFKRVLFLGLLLATAALQAQCPSNLPSDNTSWNVVSRVTYDGNWLLNSTGTTFVTAPNRQVLLPTDSNTEDFGVNDYASDSNFTLASLPFTGTIIRVGKKFNQPGQGLLSPVRRAAVATFSFNPTLDNCKIRVYYIGGLQESSTDPYFYSTVIANYRKDPDNQPASFGLFCKYNYNSAIPSSNTPSTAGKSEYGTVTTTNNTTFTNSAANVSYGLNDMFSFYQNGTSSGPVFPTTGLNKFMTGWNSYDMDFSEFIGGTVTVTLFANTSNYSGSSQNHSYCYYHLECLNNGPTTLPQSNLSISPNEQTPTEINLGCFEPNSVPKNTPVQIINGNPTLLGTLLPLAYNNNTAFKWLNLEGVSSNTFNSNFASVKLELKDPSGNYTPYNGISRSGTTTPTSTVSNPNFLLTIPSSYTASTPVPNGNLYTFLFRVTYSTWKNSNLQTGYFQLKLEVLNVTTCDQNPNITVTVGGTNPSLVSTYSSVTTTSDALTNLDYGICLPLPSSSECNIKLSADNTTCVSNTYQWQRKRIVDMTWTSIANQTGQSLSNAQIYIYTTACATQFRRVNVTSVSSSDCSASIQSAPDRIVTLWNKSYMPYTTNTNVTIADATTNSTLTVQNVSLGKKIILCYGDLVSFASTISLGDINCSLPNAGIKAVTIQFVKNYVTGGVINPSDILYQTQQNFNNTLDINTNSFSYNAINGSEFNFSGASTFALVPITIIVSSSVDGCTYKDVKTFATLQIFPRAVGGGIVAPTCPLSVDNDSSIFTMSFNSSSTSVSQAYTWFYSTNGGANWTVIPGQGDSSLPLWSTTLLGITKPFIVKRTANSGNNCGGAQDSNQVVVSGSGIVPNFTLPNTICKGGTLNTTYVMPTVSGVQGNWYAVNSNNTINTTAPISQLDLSLMNDGVYSYLFVPAPPNNNANICYDFVKWTVTLYSTTIPTFSLASSYCDTQPDFVLPTTSNNNIGGTWSVATTAGTVPVTNWSVALYSSYDSDQDGILHFFFTANSTSGTTPCASVKELAIQLLHPIMPMTLPTALCLNSTPLALPSQANMSQGQWTLGSTPVTQVNTATLGTFTYTYSATNACAPYTYTVTIDPPVTPSTLSGLNTIHLGDTTTITPSILGGTWSATSTSIATVTTTGLVQGTGLGTTTVVYTLSGAGACPAVATPFTITVTGCTDTTIWDGVSWSNGTPNTSSFLGTAVIFNANYPAYEDLYACTVKVTTGHAVSIKHIGLANTTTASTLTVMNEVVVEPSATLTFEDDSSLVQINDFANTGNIIYKRTTPLVYNRDYTYWSSPVAGQTLQSLVPGSLRYYYFNAQNNYWDPAPSTPMETAKGYIAWAPESQATLNNIRASFTGVPNNGTYTVPVYTTASNANLIGNPYPSGLDLDCFLADPANAHLNGTVYFWTHNVPVDMTGATQQGSPNDGLYNYNRNSYIAYNLLGGIGSGIINLPTDANHSVTTSNRSLGKVAAGQGFFIETNAPGVATFRNSMRVGSQDSANSLFYRNGTPSAISPSSCAPVERHRLWLQMTNSVSPQTQFRQTLVGYASSATTSATLDRNFDALDWVSEPFTIDFYSLNPHQDALAIQGRNLGTSFDANDVIPLGFNCKKIGTDPTNTITIALSEWDGLFNNQEVYLRVDTAGTGVYSYYNLKQAPYTFAITIDTSATNRFALVFKAPYTTQLAATSCGRQNLIFSNNISATAITGATGYEWNITRNSDSVNTTVTSLTSNLTLNSIPNNFIRYNETYTVRVRAIMPSVVTAFGSACTFSTVNLITTIANTICGATLPLSTTIGAATVNTATPPSNIASAPGYVWTIINTGNNFDTVSFGTTGAAFVLNQINGWTPQFNTTYTVSCTHLNSDSSNTLTGTTCTFTTANYTPTGLYTCGMTVSSSSTTIIANAVTNASGYHWEFTKGGVTVFADTATRTITLAALAATNPGFITPSTTYQVRVRPQNGAVYGPSCALTTTATFSFAPTTPPNAVAAKETLLDSNVCAYPNPFDTGFQLKWDTPLTSEVHVALYDLLGHLIFQEQYTPQELENHTFAMPLAPGMYLAVIRQEGYEKSIKIIKK